MCECMYASLLFLASSLDIFFSVPRSLMDPLFLRQPVGKEFLCMQVRSKTNPSLKNGNIGATFFNFTGSFLEFLAMTSFYRLDLILVETLRLYIITSGQKRQR